MGLNTYTIITTNTANRAKYDYQQDEELAAGHFGEFECVVVVHFQECLSDCVDGMSASIIISFLRTVSSPSEGTAVFMRTRGSFSRPYLP